MASVVAIGAHARDEIDEIDDAREDREDKDDDDTSEIIDSGEDVSEHVVAREDLRCPQKAADVVWGEIKLGTPNTPGTRGANENLSRVARVVVAL